MALERDRMQLTPMQQQDLLLHEKYSGEYVGYVIEGTKADIYYRVLGHSPQHQEMCAQVDAASAGIEPDTIVYEYVEDSSITPISEVTAA